jgi:hypothetical protein
VGLEVLLGDDSVDETQVKGPCRWKRVPGKEDVRRAALAHIARKEKPEAPVRGCAEGNVGHLYDEILGCYANVARKVSPEEGGRDPPPKAGDEELSEGRSPQDVLTESRFLALQVTLGVAEPSGTCRVLEVQDEASILLIVQSV